MLCGRTVICALLERSIEGGRSGEGSTLLLSGEPGVGKTALLDYAIERAGGLCVLRANGVRSETNIAFAGLADLLTPLAPHFADLPASQGAALSGALALGPAQGVDQLTICAAALSLLGAAASREPLLIGIDDGQWLDDATLRVLGFAARRLRGAPVLFLFTWRNDTPIHDALAGFAVENVGGLDVSGAQELLRAAGGLRSSSVPVEWLVAVTGGNPLALLELPDRLNYDGFSELIHSGEPVPVGPLLEQGFARRLSGLPSRTVQALLVASLLDGSRLERVEAAVGEIGQEMQAFAPAEDAGLLELRPQGITWRHSLVRSAVYQTSPASARRVAHLAAAAALRQSGDLRDAEASVWHRAAAAMKADEAIAAALVACGEAAKQRGSLDAAAIAFERSAELTEDPQAQIDRLTRAASAAMLAGSPDRTERLLKLAETHKALTDAALVEISHLRGLLETWTGAPTRAAGRLRDVAVQVSEREPARAVDMLLDAAVAAVLSGDMAQASDICRETLALSEPLGGVPVVLGQLLTGSVQALRGETRSSGLRLDAVRPILESAGASPTTVPLLVYLAAGYLFIDRLSDADQILSAVTTMTRSAGAVGSLPFALSLHSVVKFRSGDWDGAYADATESVQLSRDTGRMTDLPNCLAVLSLVEGGRGSSEAVEHSSTAAEMAVAMGAQLIEAQSYSMRGQYELAAGDADGAIRYLTRCGELADSMGVLQLGHLRWAHELVEAHVRRGTPEAAAAAMRQVEQAATDANPLLEALAGRCRGLLAADDTFESQFRATLDIHAVAHRPFELARTRLCFGERLRRNRRRADARDQLETAWQTFAALGARRWLERAAAELAACGLPTPVTPTTPGGLLTPQEMQVSLVVAGGASNREAAANLFISPKTVEYHLSSVYRKLHLTSRDQLADVLTPTGAS